MAVDHARLEALREVRGTLRDCRCALVGATALEVRLGLRWRTTNDLDLAVDLNMAELVARIERIPGWRRRGNQRWDSANRVPVDLIPAGSEEIAAGELVWPETGARMNLVGFDHALLRSEKTELAHDLAFPVAPAAVLTLLKMAAYLDRPAERGKDLQDLVYLLTDYLSPENPRRYHDDVFRAELDYEQVSGFVLGRELQYFSDEDDREVIRRFLSRARDPEDPHGTLARMARLAPPASRDNIEELLEWLRAFELGLSW